MKSRITLILLLGLMCLGAGLCPVGAEAADLSNAFFESEACARALRKNPAAMKYRHNWERCIAQFQEVYQKDPKGPWAPASMYQIGSLHAGLYTYSKNEADQRAAVEQFQQLQKKFPDSAYRDRAGAELQRIAKSGGAGDDKSAKVEPKTVKEEPKPVAAKTPAPARERAAVGPALPPPVKPSRQYVQAEACFKKLAGARPTERTRREWMLCIGRFHSVYLEDPEGPSAPAGLFMEGLLYQDLYKGLKFDSDLRAARENFEKIIKEFPQSPYAAKAAAGIQGMPQDGGEQAVAVRKTPPPAARPAPARPATPAAEADDGVQGEAADDDGRAVVNDLQYWSNPNYTRVVVYADRETDYTHRLLKKDPSIDKPPRLYVDLGNSRLIKSLQKSFPINDDLLSDARAGQYTRESVRVVVDIKSFETYKVFSLKDPFRIVIDVSGTNGVAQAGAGGASDPSLPPESGPGKSGKVPRGALAKQLALGVRRIVVDPGHGGKDFGAPGFVPGVHEKDVVLEISKRVARKIREELNCEAILTRSDDRYLTLEERTAFANTRSADLFVSIHTNASRDPRAFGIETYFLNLATDDESIRVAAMENATSTKNISDLSSILNDLLKNAKINESSRMAGFVQTSLIKHLNRKGYDRIRDKGVKQAPFYVLLGARMPSILVETSFLSNREECRRLTSAAYQEHLAEAIVDGLRGYIQEISPTAFAAPPAGDSG